MKKDINKAGILIGQKIAPEKREAALQLRKSMTPAENKLWKCMRRYPLKQYRFRRQQIIDGFIVDFYCHMHGLVIEVDGGIHNQQKDYDAARQQAFEDRGLVVLRFTNEKVFKNSNDVVREIIRTLGQESCY